MILGSAVQRASVYHAYRGYYNHTFFFIFDPLIRVVWTVILVKTLFRALATPQHALVYSDPLLNYANKIWEI